MKRIPGTGPHDTTRTLITTYTRDLHPPHCLHSPAHQVLLLSISSWPETRQTLFTWSQLHPQSLPFPIFPPCCQGDLSKMQSWSLHVSLGSLSFNSSSSADTTELFNLAFKVLPKLALWSHLLPASLSTSLGKAYSYSTVNMHVHILYFSP